MKTRRAAFTLVEIMIVVAILADIAIIGIPSFIRARMNAQNARFCADLRTVSAAFEMYATEHSRYPAEAPMGVLPEGMGQYLRGVTWTATNSIGGAWDWDYDQGYAKAAICTETPRDMDTLQSVAIDARIDDGILATGSFRERTPNRRWAYILE